MSMLFVFLLTAIFLLLAVCMIWSTWHWAAKALLIVLTLVVSVCVMVILYAEKGWAVQGDLPHKFLLAHTMTREPNPHTKDPGAIYYVLIERGSKGWPAPRLYQQPWSEKGHRDATELQKKIKQTDSAIWVEKTNGQADDGDSELVGTLKRAAKGAAVGFGYYEDTSQHGLVPANTTSPTPKGP